MLIASNHPRIRFGTTLQNPNPSQFNTRRTPLQGLNPGRSELADLMLSNQIMINQRVQDYLIAAEQLDLTPEQLNQLAGAAGLKAGQSGLNYFA